MPEWHYKIFPHKMVKVGKLLMDIKRVVSQNIREFRIRLGLTQQQLAERTKLNMRHLNQMERTPQNLTLDTVQHLAKGLEAAWTNLWEGLQSTPPDPQKKSLQAWLWYVTFAMIHVTNCYRWSDLARLIRFLTYGHCRRRQTFSVRHHFSLLGFLALWVSDFSISTAY